MPTYEYACTSCHRHFEVVQRFSDAPLETCEVCEGTLKRVFHPIGIVLKGSGFYATDSRSGKALPPTPKDKMPDASEKAATDTKADTKADTKKQPDKKAAPDSKGSGASSDP